MPCDQQQTASVKLEQADSDLLRASLIALGWVNVDAIAGGVINADHYSYGAIRIEPGRAVQINARFASQVDTIKQEYTVQSLKRATGRFSWRMDETTSKGKKVQS